MCHNKRHGGFPTRLIIQIRANIDEEMGLYDSIHDHDDDGDETSERLVFPRFPSSI